MHLNDSYIARKITYQIKRPTLFLVTPKSGRMLIDPYTLVRVDLFWTAKMAQSCCQLRSDLRFETIPLSFFLKKLRQFQFPIQYLKMKKKFKFINKYLFDSIIIFNLNEWDFLNSW